MINRPILSAFCVTAGSFIGTGVTAHEVAEIVERKFEKAIRNLRANRWLL